MTADLLAARQKLLAQTMAYLRIDTSDVRAVHEATQGIVDATDNLANVAYECGRKAERMISR